MGNVDAHTYARQLTVMPNGERVGVYGKVVMLMLAHYASPLEGIAWPSGERLATECAMSQSTLSRTLKHLADGGCIKSVKRRRGGGHYWDVLYGVRQTPALDPEVFAFAQEAKATQIELLPVAQKQPTPAPVTFARGTNLLLPVAQKQPTPAPVTFARGTNLLLPVAQKPYEEVEKNTRVSQSARNGDIQPITVGNTSTVAARAENSVAQGSAQIRLPTTHSQARENGKSTSPPASGLAEAPPELQPYLDALDQLASIGPLVGKQNTANCRNRRLREVRRLYVAKVPASVLAGYDGTQPSPLVPDAFQDGKAVDWALQQHAAPTTRPGARMPVDRIAQARALQAQRSSRNDHSIQTSTRAVPSLTGHVEHRISGPDGELSR